MNSFAYDGLAGYHLGAQVGFGLQIGTTFTSPHKHLQAIMKGWHRRHMV